MSVGESSPAGRTSWASPDVPVEADGNGAPGSDHTSDVQPRARRSWVPLVRGAGLVVVAAAVVAASSWPHVLAGVTAQRRALPGGVRALWDAPIPQRDRLFLQGIWGPLLAVAIILAVWSLWRATLLVGVCLVVAGGATTLAVRGVERRAQELLVLHSDDALVTWNAVVFASCVAAWVLGMASRRST